MPDSSPHQNGSARFGLSPVKWRHSMYFRVILLCCVLLLCLFASIFIIVRYTIREAVREVESKSYEIADEVYKLLETYPLLETEEVAGRIMQDRSDAFVKIEPLHGRGDMPSRRIYQEYGEDGAMQRFAVIPLERLDMVLTARFTAQATTDVLRAFKNRYILLVTFVFIVTLWIMVYYIHKTLRPLLDLSDTCAAITEGNLQTVQIASSTGEVQLLERKFNDMVESLREKEVMEVKLRQAQRLSALGNLAAGVAHDVRNPLNAIKLLSSHAIDSMGGGDESPAVKPLMTIRDEVDRLEEIVSGFLSLARERELDPQPNRVDTLLADCVRLFRKDAEERGVELIADLKAGDTLLMLDAKQWNRAILNILLNSLEACPRGGHVRLSSAIRDGACRILVEDDGPGLPREALERVFDPYYTTKPGGTGLGLSITRGIIEEHGGAIEIVSQEGRGCRVRITVPLEQRVSRPNKGAGAPAP
ncbi:MAG: HAMP domain-containing protein [Candidatus Hydrogenedentes bacterium]|nr:HAMP domain-containing protein [Candidatus Hydrogenedentota bacterium]